MAAVMKLLPEGKKASGYNLDQFTDVTDEMKVEDVSFATMCTLSKALKARQVGPCVKYLSERLKKSDRNLRKKMGSKRIFIYNECYLSSDFLTIRTYFE